MILKTVQVENYKCFADTGPINLHSHINVVVGENNSGKSTFLEALTCSVVGRPHKSLVTMPVERHPVKSESIVKITTTTTPIEIKELALKNGVSVMPFPLAVAPESPDGDRGFIKRFFLQSNSIPLEFCFKSKVNEGPSLVWTNWPDLYGRPLQLNANNRPFLKNVEFLSDGEVKIGAGSADKIPEQLKGLFQQELRRSIYRFQAERLNVGEHSFGNSRVLMPNASNLPEVMSSLLANRHQWELYSELVSQVFPRIQSVTVRPKLSDANKQELIVWPKGLDKGEEHLAVPLSESGTGVGQVLAILYVIVTASEPRIIVIDEPNSFLHPGAAKALISILRTFRQHQFIISTHSAEILNAAAPCFLHQIKHKDAESVVESVTSSDLDKIRGYVAELGLSPADFFGVSSVVWVEGPTEELCFRELTRDYQLENYLNVAFLSVRATGDFEGRRIPVKLLIYIYERLSSGASALPPATAFLLDKESRSDKEQSDLIKESKNKIKFLPVRMLENYFLNAKSIVESMAIFDAPANLCNEEKVSDWMKLHAMDEKYFMGKSDIADFGNSKWYEKIDGAKFIGDMFNELSSAKFIYRKVLHGPEIMRKQVKNNEPRIAELKGILEGILASEVSK